MKSILRFASVLLAVALVPALAAGAKKVKPKPAVAQPKTAGTVPKAATPAKTTAPRAQTDLEKKPDLDHVDAPKSDVSDSAKKAFQEDEKEKKDKK